MEEIGGLRPTRRLPQLQVFCFLSFFTGGYAAGSLAIMTDAAHMLTDFIGFVIGLFAIWLSHKSPTKYMNYGWHRAGKIETTAKNDVIMMLCLLFLSLRRLNWMHFVIGHNVLLH